MVISLIQQQQCDFNMFFFLVKHTDELNLLSFSEPTYVVVESEGQVEVCINSLVPVVRNVTARVITVSQTATGMYYVVVI